MVAGVRVALLASSAALAAVSATASSLPDLNITDPQVPLRQLQLDGLRLFHWCGADIFSGDTTDFKSSNPNDCPRRCEEHGACDAGTWTNYEGGTCWLKTFFPSTSPKNFQPNAGAVSFAWLRGTEYGTKPFVAVSRSNVDMAGFDAGSASCRTPFECGQMCAGLIQCFAATWTKYNGGTCWFKSRASAFIPKAGATSFIVARPDKDWWHDCPRL